MGATPARETSWPTLSGTLRSPGSYHCLAMSPRSCRISNRTNFAGSNIDQILRCFSFRVAPSFIGCQSVASNTMQFTGFSLVL